jgi:hypothetical protein
MKTDYLARVEASHPDGKKAAKRLFRKLVREAVYASHLSGIMYPSEDIKDRAKRLAKELIP